MSREPSTEAELGHVPVVRGEHFESFYARQWRRLVGLAFAVSGSQAVAEDLVQDALEAAFRDWERIRRLEDPETWVRRILLNRAASGYRRRVTELKVLSRVAGRRETDGFLELSGDIESIWAEVRRLPKRQVQVIALRYVEEHTMAEIGSILGCSKESVNTHFRRARATLARRLKLEDEA